MSQLTEEKAARATPGQATFGQATFGQAVRAEWAKLWGLRSTAYTLVAYVVLAVGLIIPISFAAADAYHAGTPAERAEFVPMEIATGSLPVALLAVLVLGVLVVTGEYATGSIRPSLAAVPRRGWLLTAKALVFGAVILAVATATGFGTFFLSQGILAMEQVPSATLADPHVLRAVLGIGLFVTAVGLLAVAVGTITRATAGGIAAMVVLVLILPILTGLLPERLAELVDRYSHLAGYQVTVVAPAPDALGPWAGFGVLSGFVAAALAAAYVLFRRRDA